MNRLIIQIEGKLHQGICGQPYKIVFKQDLHKKNQQISPKKCQIVENYGQIHLYKDNRLIPAIANQDSQLPLVRSTMVLVMGLLQSSLDAVVSPLMKQKSDVIEIQVLKDRNKRIYLVIVFKGLASSEEFFSKYQFRLMEDNSHLLCFFLKDQIYINRAQQSEALDHIYLLGKIDADLRQWIQLPTCISCLQRIECKLSGIQYNYCGDELPNRPVNCYLCNLLINHSQSKCSECQQEKDLWCCLICYHIACGRYKGAHAQEHFLSKNHTLAIQLTTQRVWNYMGDSFAHRIIKSDNSILNFPQYEFDQHKLQSVQGLLWEYCTKISQQLQKQRISYSHQLQQVENRHKQQQKTLKDEILKLQQKKKIKIKQAQVVKARKTRIQLRKKQLKDQINQQKQFNKLLQKQIKTAKFTQCQSLINKRKQLKQLQDRVTKMLSQMDFQ